MPETVRTPVFTRYELIDELGSGGMGAVYKARQKYVGRLVAFKVLPPALRNDTEALERFEREASALGRLDHPNVVGVFDAGVEGGFPYLAMEYVEGKNLRQVFQERGRLSVDDTVRLGIEMADALDHVQQQGLVHRDVKPSNIMLDPTGKAMLTDFGIAFAATLPRITQGAMGTPEFMSPEQADGKTPDIRSDLYGLGVVLYECLAGAVPFRRDGDSLTSLSQLLNKVLHDPPPRLDGQATDVPVWLAEVVYRCMLKNPEERFQSGAILADALRQGSGWTNVPSRPTPAPKAEPPPPPITKKEPPVPKRATHAPKPKPETPQTHSRREPTPKPPPAPVVRQQTAGWTGSFVYRTSSNPTEIPDAPPSSLPVTVPSQKPDTTSKKSKAPVKKKDVPKRGPRASNAFKIWFLLGLLVCVFLLFDRGIPAFEFGLIAFNIACLTPAFTGALVTMLSRSKKKARRPLRGLFLGTILGFVLSLVMTGVMGAFIFEGALDTLDDELIMFILAASAVTTTISAAVTGLVLAIRSLFSST